MCGGGSSPPPPPPACEYEDKKGTEWCAKKAKNAKKLSKLCSSGKAKKCENTCDICPVAVATAPPPSPCVDGRGADWCAKKAKNAKKLSKLCSSGKAKKCEATCGCDR